MKQIMFLFMMLIPLLGFGQLDSSIHHFNYWTQGYDSIHGEYYISMDTTILDKDNLQSVDYHNEEHPRVNDEWYADFERFTITSQSGEVQDSLACINQESYYYIYNFKKVPKEGLYMDTVCYADSYGRYFQLKVFKDQKLILSAGAYYPYKELNPARSMIIEYINKNLIECDLD